MHNLQGYIGCNVPPSLSIEMKERRIASGLSQQEITTNALGSEQSGKQYILSRVESGRQKKITSEICILCRYYDIDLRKHVEFPDQSMSELLAAHIGNVWKSNPKKGLLAYQILKNLS